MPLKSAVDDLKNTTLRSVGGILARLEYFVRRRRPDGSYEHWGLTRVHGERAAEEAMAEAHRAALTGVLRTPLRDLLDDAAKSSQEQGLPVSEYVEDLSRRMDEVLPAKPGVAAARHLRSVGKALAALVRSR